MTSQPWTVYIKEINFGHVSFETKEDAEAWLNASCLEYDDINWTDSETISQELVHEPD